MATSQAAGLNPFVGSAVSWGGLAVESRGCGKKECLTFMIFTDFYTEGKYTFSSLFQGT